MTTKKPRKSLNDSLASEFVYGSEQRREASPLGPEESVEPPSQTTQTDVSTAASQQPTTVPVPLQKESLMSKLMEPEKEATTRVTVDLPKSMHRKLSILCAKTGRTKVDIIRLLLAEALQEVDD
jgi:hypothetical protein